MNLFDRNQNDLSRYCYDLSKACVVSFIVLPFVSGPLAIKKSIVGFMIGMLLLSIAMTLKRKEH